MISMLKHSITIIIFLTSFSAQSTSKNKETYEYLDLFGQIFDKVRSEYVEEVTDQELIEKAIDGMLTGLDPHSGYMDEEVWEEMQMDTQGKFGGLGIEVSMEAGVVKVITPIDDTPASKAGIIGLTKSAAKELASRNISVNAIAPGYIETEMTEGLSESVRSDLLNQIPMGTIGKSEDVAHVALFLASDEAGYITGQVISVNGGLHT